MPTVSIPPTVPVRTVSNPTPPGDWTNVTDPATITSCRVLIQQSTSDSGINSTLDDAHLLKNIQKLRTTIWCSPGSGNPLVTIAFHGFDTATVPGTRLQRFCFCAGFDISMAAGDAYALMRSAVLQFAAINLVTLNSLYLWVKQGYPPTQNDRIWSIFSHATNHDVSDVTAGFNEPQTSGQRWVSPLTTWRLKQFPDFTPFP